MNRLNQFKRMTQMIQSNQSINWVYVDLFWKVFDFTDLFRKPYTSLIFFGKRSISLTSLRYFYSIQLIQSYQSLKVNRLSHLLYENELTQSPINSLGKGTEAIQLILRKNESIQINQFSRVDWYISLLKIPVFLGTKGFRLNGSLKCVR